jgi:hypothetical protein
MSVAPRRLAVGDELGVVFTAHSLCCPTLCEKVIGRLGHARAWQGSRLRWRVFRGGPLRTLREEYDGPLWREPPMKSIADVLVSCGGALNGSTSRAGNRCVFRRTCLNPSAQYMRHTRLRFHGCRNARRRSGHFEKPPAAVSLDYGLQGYHHRRVGSCRRYRSRRVLSFLESGPRASNDQARSLHLQRVLFRQDRHNGSPRKSRYRSRV